MSTTKEALDAVQAETAFQQAMSYVWGYQDARGECDSDQSFQFAVAYRSRKEAYLSERTFWMPNIADAWKEWLATGEITVTR